MGHSKRARRGMKKYKKGNTLRFLIDSCKIEYVKRIIQRYRVAEQMKDT